MEQKVDSILHTEFKIQQQIVSSSRNSGNVGQWVRRENSRCFSRVLSRKKIRWILHSNRTVNFRHELDSD